VVRGTLFLIGDTFELQLAWRNEGMACNPLGTDQGFSSKGGSSCSKDKTRKERKANNEGGIEKLRKKKKKKYN